MVFLRTLVDLPPGINKEFSAFVEKTGLSRADLVRIAVIEYLAKWNKNEL